MIRAFGSSQDGTTVVLGYQSARVELWNYDDGDWRLVYTDAATPSVPTAAAVSEDGDRFAVGDIDGNLTMYERGDDGKFASSPPIELMPSEVRRLHFSTSGKRALAVSLGAMSIASNEDERGWVTGARIASATDITNAAFLDVDGTQVLTNGNNSTARLWIETVDANWTTAETFGSQERHARSLTVSPDGTVFATGGNDNPVVQIWGPAAAQDWRSFLKVTQGIGLVENVEDFTDGHTRFNAQPAISPNGLRIAIGDVYGIVTIRDKATDRELALIDASHNPQYGIAFSEDGTLLQILDGEGLYTGLDFPVEVAVNLSGSELIQRVCRDRLGGTLAVLDESDTEVAPLLADRQAEDVCAPSNLWKQFVETIGFFLGVRPPQ